MTGVQTCALPIYIGYSLYEAKIYAGIGDEKSARMNLDYVIAEGGRLVYVERAKELLQRMDSDAADLEPPNGELEKERLSDG